MTNSDKPELISVILPVYNGEHSIEASVSSVLSQTYENLELLIVDDASDDNTHEICRMLNEKDNRIRLLSNLSNRGALRTRTKGVMPTRCCRTWWIWVL